jgi:hypothetical protein
MHDFGADYRQKALQRRIIYLAASATADESSSYSHSTRGTNTAK